MKVLITGIAGMVGSHAAEYFARIKGNSVCGVDSLIRSRLFGSDRKSVEYNWEYLSKFKNIDLNLVDIRDIHGIDNLMRDTNFDLVIHAAAQPGIGFSLKNPQEDFDINAKGTLNILETMRKHIPASTFIYCSTNKVYGENVSYLCPPLAETNTRYETTDVLGDKFRGVNETMPIDHTAHTPYGVSKYIGDLYTQEYAKTYNMRTAVFRMSCIYGERQFGFEDQGWLTWLLIAALKGKKITIYGDGKQVRDVLFVNDLVKAFHLFYLSKIGGGVYNIGGGTDNTTSLKEYIHFLENYMGRKIRIEHAPWRKSDQKVYISDIRKAEREFGWRPKVSIDKGLCQLIHWVKKHKGIV